MQILIWNRANPSCIILANNLLWRETLHLQHNTDLFCIWKLRISIFIGQAFLCQSRCATDQCDACQFLFPLREEFVAVKLQTTCIFNLIKPSNPRFHSLKTFQDGKVMAQVMKFLTHLKENFTSPRCHQKIQNLLLNLCQNHNTIFLKLLFDLRRVNIRLFTWSNYLHWFISREAWKCWKNFQQNREFLNPFLT
jgi:hypothetical protein